MNIEPRLQLVEGIPNFWTRVTRSHRRFLALDYDGTLAPFKIERMKAKPLPGTAAMLTKIASHKHTRLVVVSGRPVAEVEKLLGQLPIEIVGVHGFEVRDTNGHVRYSQPDQQQIKGLEVAYRSAVEAGYRRKVERKLASVAFHTRGNLDGANVKGLVKCLWQPLVEENELELRDFDGGVELRAVGRDKGSALLEMLQTESDQTLAVYVGDDDTDEDAFRAIRELGIGIKVGGYGLRTAASGRLPNCEGVLSFLRSWDQVTANG